MNILKEVTDTILYMLLHNVNLGGCDRWRRCGAAAALFAHWKQTPRPSGSHEWSYISPVPWNNRTQWNKWLHSSKGIFFFFLLLFYPKTFAWVILAKRVGIGPVDCLSWQPQHSCNDCSIMLWGNSACQNVIERFFWLRLLHKVYCF